jgi:hypothetical protein
MTAPRPSVYLNDIVLPTVEEFERDATSIRRAYLACVTVYHFVDAVAHATSKEVSAVMLDITSDSQHFQTVRDIAVLAKHQWLDPGKPGNKGCHLISQNDLEVGPGAAFDDGTYWDDGTSWTDMPDVVRVRDDHGSPVDVLFCVRDAVRSIRGYLASNPRL